MKVHTMKQHLEDGSANPEWMEVRSGKITGSVAKKLVTPTGKPSVQYKQEIGRIIAEAQGWQFPEFINPTYWMERGISMEEEARNWFQVQTGLKVIECGFIEHDSELAGFSPDGYVMDGDILIPVELKCPKPSTHIMWYLEGGLPKEHIGQCHFGLAVTDAPYMYFQSYCPNAAPVLEKVERTEYTDTMKTAIQTFIGELSEAQERIIGVVE